MILAVAGLTIVGAAAYWCVRVNLTSRYEALRGGRIHGATLIDADRQTYEDWLGAINSPRRRTLLTTNDAFSASFVALPDAGFSPDVDGYLALLAADLPDAETLSVFELIQWSNAAGLRIGLRGSDAGAPLYVYREDGIVHGFRLPTDSSKEVMHLGILQNGSYVEYVSEADASVD